MKRALLIVGIVYLGLAGLVTLLWFLPEAVRPAAVDLMFDAVRGRGDFVFAYPWLLLVGLLVGPLLAVAMTQHRRRQVGAMKFTRNDLAGRAPVTLKAAIHPWLPVLSGLGALALCVALARPQVAKTETREAEGIDIYLVLDMSGSMQAVDMTRAEVNRLAMQGMRPMNRFEIARAVLEDFVRRRQEKPWADRVGMVIFARYAFLQFPLTVDYETVLWLLDRLELNDIDASETAIGNALGQAVVGLIDRQELEAAELSSSLASLQEGEGGGGGGDDAEGENEEDEPTRIIILITDGDERGGNISALESARVAADQGIQIFPILVGRQGTVLVPRRQGAYGFGMDYRDYEYPVDPELLEEIADLSGGEFFRAENRRQLQDTLDEILGEFERQQFEEMVYHDTEEAFFPFVWAGFLFIGLELLLRYGLMRKFP